MTGPEHTGRGRQPRSGATVAAVAVLILIPLVALLWVSSYAKATPKLWGFPFFYWYQFLWVFLAAGCTFLAYALLRRGGGRPRPTFDRDTGRHRNRDWDTTDRDTTDRDMTDRDTRDRDAGDRDIASGDLLERDRDERGEGDER